LTSRAELSSSFTPHVTAWRELRGPLPIDTPNDSGEYKVWLVPFGSATIGLDGITIAFDSSNRKTDNFKVKGKKSARVQSAPCEVNYSGLETSCLVP